MKRFYYIGLVLLFSFKAVGLETQRRDGRVILIDKTCNFENELKSSLESWSRHENPIRTCEIKRISSSTQSNCELDIHDCLPQKEKDLLGLTPQKGAPNCHNFALLLKGMVSSQFNSTAAEILGYINNSPLCRKLTNSESREPGDVGFLDGPSIFEMHSFIYLSDNFYISKNGAGSSPYGIYESEVVLNGYNVPQSSTCRQNTSPAISECPMRTSFYRCLSMEDYLKGKVLSRPYRDAIVALEEYEKVLGCRAMTGEDVNIVPAKILATDTIRALKVYLKENTARVLAQDSKDEDEVFLLGSLALRLESLKENNMFYDPGGFIGRGGDDFENFFRGKASKIRNKNNPFF